MAIPTVIDLGANATLGVALVIGWVTLLGIVLQQYRQDTRSRQQFYMAISTGGFWLAFGLVQVSTTLTGIVEKGVVALAVGLFCAAVATGVRWWRLRNAGTAASGQA